MALMIQKMPLEVKMAIIVAVSVAAIASAGDDDVSTAVFADGGIHIPWR